MRVAAHSKKRLARVISIWPIGILLSLAVLSCGGYASRVAIGADYENTPDDYSYLAQYGIWVDIAPYGRVWEPNVGPDWRPFTYGNWAWTDNGWAWISYEPYGWLVFHYGYWNYEPGIGWFWIEGSEWSPAQVVWINYDGYIGWAPLPPPGITWPNPWHQERFHVWNIIRDRDFDRENIGHYRIGKAPTPRDRERRDVFHEPLGRQYVEKSTGRPIRLMKLQHRPVPVYMQPGHHPEENRPEEHRQGEVRPPENRRGEARPPENRPEEHRQGEVQPPENRPEERRQGEVQPPENRPGEEHRVQLHRMELPESERARVERYRPDVERHVLKHRDNKNAQHGKPEKGKNKK